MEFRGKVGWKQDESVTSLCVSFFFYTPGMIGPGAHCARGGERLLRAKLAPRCLLTGGVGSASQRQSPETWAVAHATNGLWARPHPALALSGHSGLWPGWGTKEVAAPNLRSKAWVDAEGPGDYRSEGWG